MPGPSVATVTGLFARSASVCRFDDGSAKSASELLDEGRRIAERLRGDGVARGDRIAIHLPNGVDYIRLLLACAAGGFVAVSVNTRYSDVEVADLIERSGARRIVADFGWHGSDMTSGDPDPDDPFVVFTTSGTTSKPKMVLHHQRSIAEHAFDVAETFGYRPADTVLVAMPLCGTFGLTSLMGAVAGGSEVIVTDFDLDTTVKLLEDHRVTAVNGSDDMFHRLLGRAADLGSVRLGGYARFNTSLDRVVAEADAVGATLTGLYGMSEVQALFSLRDPSAVLVDRARPGGTLVSPRAEYRIVDDELQLRGPSLMAGYLAEGGGRVDTDLTAAHVDDGWFRTGDLATPDDERTFEYRTRLGDTMRLGGFLVNPTEIEDVIAAIDAVAAAQVVAVDRPGGARPVAFVIPSIEGREIDEADVMDRCRSELAIHKVPVRVVTVDAFPTIPSANGTKIQRAKLRDRAVRLLEDT